MARTGRILLRYMFGIGVYYRKLGERMGLYTRGHKEKRAPRSPVARHESSGELGNLQSEAATQSSGEPNCETCPLSCSAACVDFGPMCVENHFGQEETDASTYDARHVAPPAKTFE